MACKTLIKSKQMKEFITTDTALRGGRKSLSKCKEATFLLPSGNHLISYMEVQLPPSIPKAWKSAKERTAILTSALAVLREMFERRHSRSTAKFVHPGTVTGYLKSRTYITITLDSFATGDARLSQRPPRLMRASTAGL